MLEKQFFKDLQNKTQLLSLNVIVHNFRSDISRNNSRNINIYSLAPESTFSPVIIIGMHRSGTTILSQILQNIGVFMGISKAIETNESLFFRNRNEAIFKIAHARWDQPHGIQLLLGQPHMCNSIALRLVKDCQSLAIFHYLGLDAIGTGLSMWRYDKPWGWKDPRNVFTLPIWLRVFPNAKIIHVYRNGIDVSHSLVTRERRLQGLSSLRCMHYTGAFELWSEYVEMAKQLIQTLPKSQVIEICYETILECPEEKLHELCEFLGLSTSTEKISKVSKLICREREYAFLSNPELLTFYHQKQFHPLMNLLGYSNL